MQAHNRQLTEWFNRIRAGQVLLPRFQRHEAWSHNEVAGLIETVLRGLPAGALLILEVGDQEQFHSRKMVGAPDPIERVSEHLLDGQQRLTALWRALHDDYSARTYLIGREPDEDHGGQEVWTVTGLARWTKVDGDSGEEVRYPRWVEDPAQVYDRGFIPLALLRPGDLGHQVREWADAASRGDVNVSRDIEPEIVELRGVVAAYNIPYLSLPVETPKDVALDVFIKMNTSSVRLSTFDIVVAQFEEAAGESLHDLVDGLRRQVPDAHRYRDVGNWVLDVASMREGRTPTQASYLRLDPLNLSRDWNAIVDGIAWAVETLQEEHVYDGRRLPSVAVLPILAALHRSIPTDPDRLGNARTLVRKYLWRAFLTRRYDQAAGSRALQDFVGLERMLGAEDAPLPPIFREEEYPLPTTDELLTAGWPKNREILARGILALSLRAGARDLADDHLVSSDNIQQREYHHLFPDAILTGLGGVSSSESFRALNCALITWRTNRKISARNPLQYLQDRVDGSALGENEVRARLASHLIPYDELARAGDWPSPDSSSPEERQRSIRADYDAFLAARAEWLLLVIGDLKDGRVAVERWLTALG